MKIISSILLIASTTMAKPCIEYAIDKSLSICLDNKFIRANTSSLDETLDSIRRDAAENGTTVNPNQNIVFAFAKGDTAITISTSPTGLNQEILRSLFFAPEKKRQAEMNLTREQKLQQANTVTDIDTSSIDVKILKDKMFYISSSWVKNESDTLKQVETIEIPYNNSQIILLRKFNLSKVRRNDFGSILRFKAQATDTIDALHLAISNSVIELQKDLPKMIDQYTRVNSVVLIKKSISYSYSISGLEILDKEAFVSSMKEQQVNTLCSTEATRVYLSNQYSYRYLYLDDSGINVGAFEIFERDCPKQQSLEKENKIGI